MTAPRQVLPGTTYLVTRRCAQRQFLLRPSAVTNGVFLYVLAAAARRFGVQGPRVLRPLEPFPPARHRPGRAPPRLRAVPRLARRARAERLARALGVVLGAEQLQRRRARQPRGRARQGCVRARESGRRRARPPRTRVAGLWSDPAQIGVSAIEAKRPAVFFRPNGKMPETIELELTAPPGFSSAGGVQRAGSPRRSRRASSRPRASSGPRAERSLARRACWRRSRTRRPADRGAETEAQPAGRGARQVEADRGTRPLGRVRRSVPSGVDEAEGRHSRRALPGGNVLATSRSWRALRRARVRLRSVTFA